MKKKETSYDRVQDPRVYQAIPSSSSNNASSDSATAFLSNENGQVVLDADGELCFVASSGGSAGGNR
ncbi:hypothetical protein Hanom_Chr10g00961411 [Helianthus anomalus]